MQCVCVFVRVYVYKLSYTYNIYKTKKNHCTVKITLKKLPYGRGFMNNLIGIETAPVDITLLLNSFVVIAPTCMFS